jgi:hypothetical protein
MDVFPERFRRAAAATATVTALAAVASMAAPELSSARRTTSAPNPTVLNDAHLPPAGNSDVSRAPVIVRVRGGFDWADAAAGVVAGLGLTLAGTGAMHELRRERSDHAVANPNE